MPSIDSIRMALSRFGFKDLEESVSARDDADEIFETLAEYMDSYRLVAGQGDIGNVAAALREIVDRMDNPENYPEDDSIGYGDEDEERDDFDDF